jgi:hypothetical protein
MNIKLPFVLVLPLLASPVIVAQSKPAAAAAKPRMIDGHPDLSGTYRYVTLLPFDNLKREANGAVSVKSIARTPRIANVEVKGALPWTPAPTYKAELQAKVKNLSDNESKTDPVFYCGRPGVPRIGPPRRVVQLPGEVIFLYEDMSGDPYRVIPTDGRAHRADANPSYYGDSVGHWEGNVLVVDVTNFVDDSWFGEKGYFHTDAMHVIERFWKEGDNLIYQMTVEDPNVLTAPWTSSPRVVAPSSDALEESPKCVEEDGPRLVNNDHHDQR